MTRTIATLNIGHGAAKSADALAARLLGYAADLLVVTAFRADDVGTRLIDHLERAEYDTSHPAVEPTHDSVLIASRSPIDRASAFTRDVDARHLWCAEIDGAIVCGVHLPQAHANLPYWEALIDRARRSEVELLLGDFTTDGNDLDDDHLAGRLVGSGYVDVWRALHPSVRFGRPGDNGLRVDHMYATPAIAGRVRACEFDHAPRLAGETERAALVATLE